MRKMVNGCACAARIVRNVACTEASNDAKLAVLTSGVSTSQNY